MGDPKEQGIPDVGFLVIAFTEEEMADKALAEMKAAQDKNEFNFEEAAVIRQNEHGKVKYYETGDMHGGKGAGIGALIGGVIGILGGPGGVALGAGLGAAAGGIAASGDKGFRDENIETVGGALLPGTSAIVVITSHDALKAIQDKVPAEDIKTAVANLSEEIADKLAANKRLAVRFVLSQDGLGYTQIAADDNSAEVVGAVLTAEGIAVGAAVITDEGVAYKVAGATAEGAGMEAGVITREGAVIVDAAATPDTPTDDTPPKTPSE